MARDCHQIFFIRLHYGFPIQPDDGAEQAQAKDFEAISIARTAASKAIRQHQAMLALIYEAICEHRLVTTSI